MKSKRVMGIVLSSLMVMSCTNVAYALPEKDAKNFNQTSYLSLDEMQREKILNGVLDSLEALNVSLGSEEQVELLVLSRLDEDITPQLKKYGATEVDRFIEGAYKIKISAKNAPALCKISQIRAIDVEKEIILDPIKEMPVEDPKAEYEKQDSIVKDLWARGFNGKGTTVALIDTGVEPDHELLKSTPDGKLKVVDYRDFLYAGRYEDVPAGDKFKEDLKMQEVKLENTDKVTIGAKEVKVPSNLKGKNILVGNYSENILKKADTTSFDLNNDGKVTEYPVIAYDGDDNGTYESIIFDTDVDADLTNEKVMGIYGDVAENLKDKVIFDINKTTGEATIKDEYKNDYEKLFNTVKNESTDAEKKNAKVNFVCTRLNKIKDAWCLDITLDTLGHGTNMAAAMVGNGVVKGAAPGAQLMALRVFRTSGQAENFTQGRCLRALQYAAAKGADVVALSYEMLNKVTDGRTESMCGEYIDLLTAKYGTLFVVSGGSEGPGVNSTSIPGDTKLALTIGTYNPSTDGNTKNQVCFVSGNGPTDTGTIKPDVIAQGTMISATPKWNTNANGYAKVKGSSMAVSYAAGSVAVLKQVMNEQAKDKDGKSLYHPLMLREIIRNTANKKINDGKYNALEIGQGMLDPNAVYDEIVNNYKNSNKLPKILTGDNPLTNFPFNETDKTTKYTEYNKNYIKANVLYKEETKIKSGVDISGLYIRNGEIPEEVQVDLSNFTERDANLTISKETWGSGQNTEFIQVPENVTVAKGNKATITLKIDKGKLQDGINLLNIKLDDRDTYQTDCVIPVTIIKAPKIEFGSLKTQKQVTLNAGEYTRSFVKIPEELERFKVTIEVPDQGQGNCQKMKPVLYFPNGLPYVWKDMDKCVGTVDETGKFIKKMEIVVSRDELKAQFIDASNKTYNKTGKWDGTWEVVTKCSEDAKAAGDVKVIISSVGAFFSETKQTVNVTAGEKANGKLTISNMTGKDAVVDTCGFVDLGKTEKTTKIANLAFFTSRSVYFEIKEGDENIFNKIVLSNGNNNDSGTLILTLSKVKPKGDGTYEEGMQINYLSIRAAQLERDGVMYTEKLEPGFYQVSVFCFAMGASLDFDITNQIVNQKDAVPGGVTLNGNTAVSNLEDLECNYEIKAPLQDGKYVTAINLRDKSHKLLGSIPVFVNVGESSNILKMTQDKISLNGQEVTVSIDADFPEENIIAQKLYGVEFSLKYNPEKLQAVDIIKGDIFEKNPSYEVKKEIVKDKDGKEAGEIKFAYAFKGLDFDGITKGNVSKVKFKAKDFGSINAEVNDLIVGNCEGEGLAIKLQKQNVIIANPDVNGDGVVNMKDYAYAAYSYGADQKDLRYRRLADVNKDGVIDDIDINYIVNNFKYSRK